jgi:cyclopropane-fatty-acyl-phospholipid synthase
MGNQGTKVNGRVYAIDEWLVRTFMRAIGDPLLRVTLWDGKVHFTPAAFPESGMIINDRASLCRLLINPLLYFGDDYAAGRIEIEGDLVTFMEAVYRALPQKQTGTSGTSRRSHSYRNTLRKSRHNVHHHYDIGNDFYRMWLDEEMLYTCAYFPERSASLEDAQIAKMDLVCRKLRLAAGQRVVEAGCGWGALARYMAGRYGAKVRAYNISGEQIAYARQRARAEGLEGRVEYVEDDYRNISGEYDAFVSVGMLEHVGPYNYRELGRVIDRVLTESGMGLIHTIGQNVAAPMTPWLLKRIFPGSYPPTLREMMEVFEPWGFSVLDVENLRLHYAKTLEHWLERFDGHENQVAQMFDDRFVRTWRLYLSAAIANFRLGALQLFQVAFSRPSNNRIPWTRSHLAIPWPSPDGNV